MSTEEEEEVLASEDARNKVIEKLKQSYVMRQCEITDDMVNWKLQLDHYWMYHPPSPTLSPDDTRMKISEFDALLKRHGATISDIQETFAKLDKQGKEWNQTWEEMSVGEQWRLDEHRKLTHYDVDIFFT